VPDPSEFLCGDWVWDAAMRELRHYERRKKGWSEEPDAAEQLKSVRSVTWYRWAQAPMQTSTGQMLGASQSRIVAAYEGGGDLTIDEPDRGCAEKLANAIASTYGLEVVAEGAPSGRRGGNLPSRDEMGRLVNKSGKQEVVLDEVGGEITIVESKRLFRKSRRSIRTSEIRRLEFVAEVQGSVERFNVFAIVGREEEKIPLASFEGYEGWADPQEWREFTEELARSLGVEAQVEG
jgi:hypothetical protein